MIRLQDEPLRDTMHKIIQMKQTFKKKKGTIKPTKNDRKTQWLSHKPTPAALQLKQRQMLSNTSKLLSAQPWLTDTVWRIRREVVSELKDPNVEEKHNMDRWSDIKQLCGTP